MSTMSAPLPPGPPRARTLWDQLRFANAFKDDGIQTIAHAFAKYGDMYVLQLGNMLWYQISHPDHIHQAIVTNAAHYIKDGSYTDRQRGLARFIGNGLLTSSGDFWKRQRKLMQPAFHHKRIEGYAQIMTDYAGRTLAHWRDGAVIDIDREMMETTLQIVAKALFLTEIDHEVREIGEAVDTLQETTNSMSLIPTWVPTPLELRTRRAVRNLDAVVYRLIAQRRAEPNLEDRGDLLAMLLQAEDEDGTRMTDQQIRDEVVTLILAGHETTANALNWPWGLPAQNPHVEAKLHAELDAVLAGRTPTLADLKQLPYTEMVIKESMRLYPPAWGFSREAAQDTELGGYRIPKGAVVGVTSWVTHHDPRWWGADADQCVPERFSPEREKDIPKYAYMPFGGGPRVCIGNMFAMMEAQLLLAIMAQRFRLRLQPGQGVRTDAKITLRPKGGLPMRVEARPPVQPVAAAQGAFSNTP